MDTQVAPLPVRSGSLTRWAVLPLVLFATAISMFQQHSLSAVAPEVSGNLKISLVQIGVAFSALSLAMLAGYVLVGLLLHLTGTRYGYPAVVAGSSLATAATATAGGLAGLVIPRALLGLFAGGFTPAAIDLVAEWYPIRFHGTAVGVIQVALGAAVAAVAPVLGSVADSSSWRTAMLLVAGLGVIWIPLWLGFVRPASSSGQRSFAALGYPQTWALALGLLFLAPVNAFLLTWLPYYSQRQFGLMRGGLQWRGPTAMVAMAAGALAGGLISDLLLLCGWKPAKSRTLVAGVCALLACSAGLLGLVASPGPFMVFAIISMGASAAAITALYAAVADAGPRCGVAFAAGLGAFFGLLGSIASMPLAGAVINRFGFRPMACVMGVFPLAALAGIVPLLAHMRSGEQAEQPAAAPGMATAYAGFWRRFAAALIDGALLNAVALVIFWLPVFGAGLMENAPGLVVLLYLILLAACWLYFALMESSSRQATLGKMALGIIVTSTSGGRIGFGAATGRYFGKILSSIFLIGYVMAGFTSRKQALHDMMAGTLVMRACRP